MKHNIVYQILYTDRSLGKTKPVLYSIFVFHCEEADNPAHSSNNVGFQVKQESNKQECQFPYCRQTKSGPFSHNFHKLLDRQGELASTNLTLGKASAYFNPIALKVVKTSFCHLESKRVNQTMLFSKSIFQIYKKSEILKSPYLSQTLLSLMTVLEMWSYIKLKIFIVPN